MAELSDIARAHAQAGAGLKARLENLKRRHKQLIPATSERFNHWQALLNPNAYAPKPTDRVAIVGAGPAGLHMAFLLDELGFENVTLLEKTDRVAGRSYTKYDYESFIPIEFGTCYTVPFKYAELRRCAKVMGYASFEEVPVPERNIFESYEERTPMSQDDWLTSSKIKKWPFKSMPEQAGKLAAKLAIGYDFIRYNLHYNALFKKSVDEVVKSTNMSFKDYLRQNGFDDLIPLFSLANTMQGYGYIEQVPALYGLWWNGPAEVNGFLASAVHIVEQPASILRHGFGRFWEFMVANRGFDVRANFEITSIDRSRDVVKITDSSGAVSEFDFLIVTNNLKDAMDFLDTDEEEEKLLGALKVRSNLTTTLISVKHTTNPVALSSWSCSLNPEKKGKLMTVRDSYKVFFPDDFGKKTKDFLVAYQYEPEATPDTAEHKKVLIDQLLNDLTAAGYEDIEVLEQHIWPYFQRWDQEGINALYPMELMQRQGANRTWFAGASTLFESVHDCMEYNKLLTGTIRSD